jgi:antirestriction protein ArdC
MASTVALPVLLHISGVAPVEVGAVSCALICVISETLPDLAEYLAHWPMMLKTDKRKTFTAAAQAQPAADYPHRLQQQSDG